MAWHSTGDREEVVVPVAGRVEIEYVADDRVARVRLGAAHALFIPRQTRHRVLNQSSAVAQYLYITG